MPDGQEAVDALEQLGLTEYEARCFVALTQIPHGTAKEVAKVADIPRSRVYETMDRLQNRGLVEVQKGEPQTFQSVPIDTAIRVLRKQYESYFDAAERNLQQLEPVFKENQQAVWAISNNEQVTERVFDLVDSATDEVLLIVLDERLLGDAILDCLVEVGGRGVTVHVGTSVESVRETVEHADADVQAFSTDLVEWFGSMTGAPRIGRLLMVDRGPVLVSALHDERDSGLPNETAAWSDGFDHGFATFAERVLSYELKHNAPFEFEPTDSAKFNSAHLDSVDRDSGVSDSTDSVDSADSDSADPT